MIFLFILFFILLQVDDFMCILVYDLFSILRFQVLIFF